MVALADFLEMDADEREGKYPFIWAVDRKQRLSRVLVAAKIVEACEERRDFWIMLRDLAGVRPEAAPQEDLEQKIRQEVVGKIAQGLMKMAGNNGEGIVQLATADAPVGTEKPEQHNVASGDYMAPWIDSDECTACDECIKLNGNIFAYNENKKAYIKNPNGGSYEDLVKAAEKCTARVIHPGLPANPDGKEKWIKRGEKFN